MRFPISLLILVAALVPASAEDKAAGNVYRLDFTLRDAAQGEAAKTRHYSMLLEPNNWGQLVAATKVPYTAEKDKYNFAEIGVFIHARLTERTDAVELQAKFEVSSLASPGARPVVQMVRSEGTLAVTLGKSTTVVALDDPTSQHHYEIDAIVTKL